MEWHDNAIVLSANPYGERDVVATLLTRDHGRHSGLVRSGQAKSKRGILQPGNRVAVRWRSRLAEQLGQFSCELIRAHAADVMEDAERLSGLASACAICEIALPERQAQPATFDALVALLEVLDQPSWATVYVHWELALLRDLGFGLDLSVCAATGVNDSLAFVSPKTGRAVSLSAGEPYRDRLLDLPRFLVAGGEGARNEIAGGLALTGYFLDRHVFGAHGKAAPAARTRLAQRFRSLGNVPAEG